MPLEIPVGYAHVAIEHRHQADPEPWYVTFGVDAGDAEGNVQTIGTASLNAWHNAWDDALSSQITISGAEVTYQIEDGEPIRAFVNPSVPMQGAASNEKLPQNCALLVRKNSNLGGRRNRGRFFIPGVLQENDVSATGVISTNVLNAYESYADNFWADMNDGVTTAPALPLVILHSSGQSEIPVPTIVTSLTCDNLISTQRRRMR